ncbi:hypothetical protein [Empedobacter brevis]|uniref:hypothetical protein n=1 Tax=Empedobacter brevis TaxID=247 RepID=UPI0033412160
MSTLIQTTIRPELIPVLYDFFEGKEYTIAGKKVKGVKIDLKSSLGRYIRSMCEKAERPETKRFYNMVFEVQDLASKQYTASVYQYIDGRNHFLKLPEQFIDDLNHMLEDIFRTSLNSYLRGFEKNGKIKEGIRQYMHDYDLEEHGHTLESIERMYMRYKKSPAKLKRFQHKWTSDA